MGKSLPVMVVASMLAAAAPVAAQGEAGHAAAVQIEGSSFFAVKVGDADASTRWYEETLDLAEVNRIDDEGGRFAIRLLARPGLTVEVIQQAGAGAGGDGPTLGLFKVGFGVDDIEAFHALLRRRSVDVDERIFTDAALGARSFVFRDLDGNRIQVFEPCRDECQEDAP